MSFKDADELYDYVGGIFTDAMKDDEVGPKFADSGVVLKLVYTEPTAQLLVDMPNRVVYQGEDCADIKPTIQMFMKGAVGHQFLVGQREHFDGAGEGPDACEGTDSEDSQIGAARSKPVPELPQAP